MEVVMRKFTWLAGLCVAWLVAESAFAQDAAALGRQLKDKEVQARLKAAQGLASLGPKASPAMADLLDALKGPDYASLDHTAMHFICVALGNIGKEALPGVLDVLKQKQT